MCERTLQDIEADSAELVNVGVKDLGEESDLGRRHGIVVGQEQLELEHATCDIRLVKGKKVCNRLGAQLTFIRRG